MTPLPVIAPIGTLPRLDQAALAPMSPAGAPVSMLPAPQLPVSQLPTSASFSQLLSSGVEKVNTDLLQADKMARAFAVDDSIPVHQVTYALEQARLSLDLALQMRTRLIDGYQQLMNMQL